jgi:hypothetical protein
MGAGPEIGITGRSKSMKPISFFNWYHILRVRHQLPVFCAIRDALWLAR